MKKFWRFILVVLFGFLSSTIVNSAEPKPTMLPQPVHKKIEVLSKEGDALAKKAKYREATDRYIAALDLLPEPKTQWEACTWLLVAIGDANFLSKHYDYAQRALSDAMHCPNAIGNPFIHLRLGQSQFELGNKKQAADELARAYMGAGTDIFKTEDPKYFEFLKTVLKPPVSGKW